MYVALWGSTALVPPLGCAPIGCQIPECSSRSCCPPVAAGTTERTVGLTAPCKIISGTRRVAAHASRIALQRAKIRRSVPTLQYSKREQSYHNHDWSGRSTRDHHPLGDTFHMSIYFYVWFHELTSQRSDPYICVCDCYAGSLVKLDVREPNEITLGKLWRC